MSDLMPNGEVGEVTGPDSAGGGDYMDEAVEAASKTGATGSRAVIEAAEPFIRADERKRIEEGLLSQEAVDAAHRETLESRRGVKKAIEAALVSLSSNSETEGAEDANA